MASPGSALPCFCQVLMDCLSVFRRLSILGAAGRALNPGTPGPAEGQHSLCQLQGCGSSTNIAIFTFVEWFLSFFLFFFSLIDAAFCKISGGRSCGREQILGFLFRVFPVSCEAVCLTVGFLPLTFLVEPLFMESWTGLG